jgi:8-oxo-dGTP pyrophosphatase MutT (NUDIX family)
MHALHHHIVTNNTLSWQDYIPLRLAGKDLGRVHRDIAGVLCDAKLLLEKDDILFITNEASNVEGRSQQLRDILHHLIQKNYIAKERFELYSVAPSFKDAPIALADRALISALGFIAYGVHCNGYVKKDGLHLWVGKRSSDRATDPGKFDHMIAGGQPHGLTVIENLAKEAHEEAGVPGHLIKTARAAGCITYTRALPMGIRRDALFIFDLKCPDDFKPHNQDGEVEDFRLMPAHEVLERITKTDDFKFNVNLVLIDFFIRHGMIQSDEAGYAELCAGLHPPLCKPMPI